MTLHPSVVAGVGTTGANVIANVERILYEVLGERRLEFLKLLVIETDNAPRNQDIAASANVSHVVDAFEPDLGQAMRNLSQFLGSDFNWCPKDLSLGGGRGAGNVRAGGRLMFHSRYPEISKALNRAIHDGAQQVVRNSTSLSLDALFGARGMQSPPNPVDSSRSVVYVVGTLAGGTCSGMCVDLGYAVHQIDRQCERIGVFFVPDPNAPETFRQNAWAAMRDLEFFIDNPGAFRGVWYSEQRTPLHYSQGDAKPYDRIYLVSSLNQAGQTRLHFDSSLESPLTVMVANMIAADLLGLYSLRAGKLVNLNQHVMGPEKRRTFLNFNLRGISYPKYEVSEAAACRVIADVTCENWLSPAAYRTKSGVLTKILEDDERAKGRNLWQDRFHRAWAGSGPSVDLTDLRKQVIEGTVDEPSKVLKFQFASDAQDTIFSKVWQTRRGRSEQLKEDIRAAFRDRLDLTRNLRAAELFLEGVRGELLYTKRYWESLGIPSSTSPTAWTGLVNHRVDEFERDRNSLLARLLIARAHVAGDFLEEMRTLLSMHILIYVLDEIADWMQSELIDWLRRQRTVLESLRSLAGTRAQNLVRNLQQDREGPILRVSRSKSEGFDREVTDLATGFADAMDVPLISMLEKGAGDPAERARRVFSVLKDQLQPALLERLIDKGNVNIADQLREQNHIDRAAIYLRQTLDLSLATHPSLQRSTAAVPSYVLARTAKIAQDLVGTITESHIPGLQNMEVKDLPMLDHMAIFYQEGADFEPDFLDGAATYQSAYEQRLKSRPDYIDPLGYMKTKGEAGFSGASEV